MTQLPPPVVKAYDQTSHFLSDFGSWYVAQLYSLAGIFFGIVQGVFTEGKGLLIKSKESLDNDDRVKEIKAKTSATAKSAKDNLTNGYARATGEKPEQTQHKVQQTANDATKEVKQATRR